MRGVFVVCVLGRERGPGILVIVAIRGEDHRAKHHWVNIIIILTEAYILLQLTRHTKSHSIHCANMTIVILINKQLSLLWLLKYHGNTIFVFHNKRSMSWPLCNQKLLNMWILNLLVCPVKERYMGSIMGHSTLRRTGRPWCFLASSNK